MANNMTNYLENALVDALFRNIPYTIPTVLYIALFRNLPGEAGNQSSEPSGNNYARVSVASSATTWSATNGRSSTNSPSTGSSAVTFNLTDIVFPPASGSWGQIKSIGILDSPTGGHMLWYGNLDVPRTIGDSDVFKITAGDLSIQIDDV